VSGVLRRYRLEGSLNENLEGGQGGAAVDGLDHIVKIIEQVGFPIALVMVLMVLAPRHALRLLEVFRKIMDDFADKLVEGARPLMERHESLVNRAEAITSRQEAAVSRLEAMGQLKWRNGEDVDGKP
jgi:hypothetical protein